MAKKHAPMKLTAHTLGYTGHQCIDRADTLGQQLAMGSYEYSRWAQISWNGELVSEVSGDVRCLRIVTTGANADECIDRYRRQVDMLKSGCMDVMEGVEVVWNHGSGGGP